MSEKHTDVIKNALMAHDGIDPEHLPQKAEKQIQTMVGDENAKARSAKYRMIVAWIFVAVSYIASAALAQRAESTLFPNPYASAVLSVLPFLFIAAITLTIIYLVKCRTASLAEINVRLARLELLLREEHDERA